MRQLLQCLLTGRHASASANSRHSRELLRGRAREQDGGNRRTLAGDIPLQCFEGVFIRRQRIGRHNQANHWCATIQPDHKHRSRAALLGRRRTFVLQWYVEYAHGYMVYTNNDQDGNLAPILRSKSQIWLATTSRLAF